MDGPSEASLLWRELVAELEPHDGFVAHPSIQLQSRGSWRGVYATAAIPRDTVLLCVPERLTWCVPTLLQGPADGLASGLPAAVRLALSAAKQAGASDDTIMAIGLMYARVRPDGCSQLIRRHVAGLPSAREGPSALHQTFLWSGRQLSYLEGSRAEPEARQLLMQIREEYTQLQEAVLRLEPFDPIESFSFECYQWALACVHSRGMDFPHTSRMIVPLADMFNTAPGQPCNVHAYDPHKRCMVVVASQEIACGDELFIDYSLASTSNARCLRLYGFAFERMADDTGDEVLLQAGEQVFRLTLASPLPAELIPTVMRMNAIPESSSNGRAQVVTYLLQTIRSMMAGYISQSSLSAMSFDQSIEEAEEDCVSNDCEETTQVRQTLARVVCEGEMRILRKSIEALELAQSSDY